MRGERLVPGVEIAHAGIERAGGIDHRHIVWLRLDITCIITGGVLWELRISAIVAALIHPERREDMLLQERGVGLARHPLDNIAQQDIARIAVPEEGAGRKLQGEILEASDDL